MARPLTAARSRPLRRTLTLKRAAEIVAKTFGFPDGSVRFVMPDGSEPRRQATVERLRSQWESQS